MEILEIIAEWREGCTVAGPMHDRIYHKEKPTTPGHCIPCTDGLIDAIERKLLEEKAQQDDVGTCEECGNSIARRGYATFKGKPYHVCCLPVEVWL